MSTSNYNIEAILAERFTAIGNYIFVYENSVQQWFFPKKERLRTCATRMEEFLKAGGAHNAAGRINRFLTGFPDENGEKKDQMFDDLEKAFNKGLQELNQRKIAIREACMASLNEKEIPESNPSDVKLFSVCCGRLASIWYKYWETGLVEFKNLRPTLKFVMGRDSEPADREKAVTALVADPNEGLVGLEAGNLINILERQVEDLG